MCPKELRRTATAVRQESQCPGAHIVNEYMRNRSQDCYRHYYSAGALSTHASVKSHISGIIVVHSALVTALHAPVT